MPYVVTRAEYVEVAGVPLATPGWEVTDLTGLWDIADPRGDDKAVPYRRGVVPFRRQLGAKRVDLPITVFADDPEGVLAASRAQLWANRNTLIRDVLRPRQVATTTGDITVRYHPPDGSVLSGPAKVVATMNPTPLGPAALRASVGLLLTDGGLRAETPVDVTSTEAPAGGSADVVVPNPGTDYQDRAVLTLTGTATTVTLTNLTADPGGDVRLTFGGALTGGVVVDTGAWTAQRAGTSVIGLVSHSGHERWLPLVPGDNTIRIEPVGGTATLNVVHNPFHA